MYLYVISRLTRGILHKCYLYLGVAVLRIRLECTVIGKLTSLQQFFRPHSNSVSFRHTWRVDTSICIFSAADLSVKLNLR